MPFVWIRRCLRNGRLSRLVISCSLCSECLNCCETRTASLSCFLALVSSLYTCLSRSALDERTCSFAVRFCLQPKLMIPRAKATSPTLFSSIAPCSKGYEQRSSLHTNDMAVILFCACIHVCACSFIERSGVHRPESSTPLFSSEDDIPLVTCDFDSPRDLIRFSYAWTILMRGLRVPCGSLTQSSLLHSTDMHRHGTQGLPAIASAAAAVRLKRRGSTCPDSLL